MSSQPPRTPNGDESGQDSQSNDQSGQFRKANGSYSGNRSTRQTGNSNYQGQPRPPRTNQMSPQQMTGVTQQQPQQQWQQAAHQTQQAQMYVYAPGYGQNAYAAPQTQNGQYYQYYQYAGYPQQMYQAQPAAYYYYPNTAQQPPVMYQQQQMMYQMPPPVAQQTAVPPAAAAPAAPATAPQMTQSQQQRSSAPVAPPAAGVNVPAASSVPTVPAIASTQQPLPVEEPVASEVSVDVPANTAPNASVAAAAKKKPIIKNADGSVVDVEEWKKKPSQPKESEVVKVVEPEPIVPSIPSMPVSLPKVETPIVNSFPVDIPKPAVVEKSVEEKTTSDSTPVKEPPTGAIDDESKAVLATPEQTSQRRLVPHGKKNLSTPGSKTIKKYTRQDILTLRPAELPQLDLFKNIVVQKLDAPMQKGPGSGGDWGKGAKGPKNAGGNDWKHESVPSAPTQGKKKAPTAPPKQEITDPMKLIELYITDILNKIAPEKFDRLSKQLLDADLKDSTMLDKLVRLIFEKAVKEPHFAEMYAQLCTFLKEEGGKKWIFYKIVKNNEDNNFFWIKDFSFPAMASGPFFSKSAVFSTEDLGQMKPYTGTLDGCEYYLNKQTLIRLIPAKLASGDQWFVTHVSFDEIKMENRSTSVYQTEAEALKNATSTVSFRGSLAHSCEREFQYSVADENLFDEVDQELKQLIANRATITEEEYLVKESEIGEKRNKLKQRMLGNIRFVGELYKQKLLNTDTMHDCITTLLGHPGNWKTNHDIQDLELLCKLLTTVGSYLEQKSKGAKRKPEWESNFDAYFERLFALTKEKSLEARIRFSIEDVIDLRKNNWKERREKEGPLKISEIHQKAQEEEQLKGQITRQNSGGDARNIGTKSGDARNGPGNAKGGRGGATGRGNGNAKQSKAQPSATPVPTGASVETIDAKSLDFTNDALKRRAKTTLLEYMNGEDVSEVKATLKEGSNVFLGFLLNDVIEKLLNAKGGGAIDRLMDIFNDEELVKSLQTYSMVVESALEQNEFFKVLVDTSLDFKEAPERIAQVVRILIQKSVISSVKIQEIVEKLKKDNIDLDYNPVEDINTIYERFLKSVA